MAGKKKLYNRNFLSNFRDLLKYLTEPIFAKMFYIVFM